MYGVEMLETVNSRYKVIRCVNDSQLETVLFLRTMHLYLIRACGFSFAVHDTFRVPS